MRHIVCGILATGFIVLLAGTGDRAGSQPVGPKKKLDQEGGALPHGAIARVGSARFRTGEAISAMAYLPDGKSIAVASHFNAQILDATTGVLKYHLKPNEAKGFLRAMAVHPDGKRIDLFRYGTLSAFDPKTGEPIGSIAVPAEPNTY